MVDGRESCLDLATQVVIVVCSVVSARGYLSGQDDANRNVSLAKLHSKSTGTTNNE